MFSSGMCSHHVTVNSSYLDIMLMITVIMEPVKGGCSEVDCEKSELWSDS